MFQHHNSDAATGGAGGRLLSSGWAAQRDVSRHPRVRETAFITPGFKIIILCSPAAEIFQLYTL
jgi:hypothetical protein